MANVSLILGGVGLFILSISLLTEGLKGYAGENLRVLLTRFITGKYSAIFAGTLVAVLVQSSSATILATIGFVSAGLLTFSQSIGIILGANLGTTSTTWIVSVLGFKFSIGIFAMPIIFLGALLKVLGNEKRQSLGIAIAGFGLIFVALEFLQSGMGQFSGVIENLLKDQFAYSILLLIVIGIVITVILQSSSAALATTLTALHQDVISYDQALVIAIGQNLGTTVKAFIAALGASRAAQRTAICHILFNIVTALIALLLLSWLGRICWQLSVFWFDTAEPLIALSLFHTVFNLLGVLFFLPWLGYFSVFIERIRPDTESGPLRNLDDSVLEVPSVALEAAERALRELGLHVAALLSRENFRAKISDREFSELSRALDGLQDFLAKAGRSQHSEDDSRKFLSLLHALEHLTRLSTELKKHSAPSRQDFSIPLKVRQSFFELLNAVLSEKEVDSSTFYNLEHVVDEIKATRRVMRAEALERATKRESDVQEAIKLSTDILFWDSSVYHLWRCAFHLSGEPASQNASKVVL